MVEEIADMSTMLELMRGREGISPIERLLNQFEAHESKEEKSIECYKKTLGEIANPMTRFLLQMIVSDEEKHRAVIHSMAATLKGSLNWTKPSGSFEDGGTVADANGRLRVATDEFIRIERAGIQEYRALIEESNGYYHGLFKILIESMIRDSEKHVELLEFLKQSMESA